MRAASSGSAISKPNSNQYLLFLAVLGLSLGVLFSKSFEPHKILFDNDTPLGILKAEQGRLPDRFTGCWHDLGWLGGAGPTATPTMTSILGTIMPRELFLKIYPPFTLLFLGFSAWVFFRSLRLNPAVCVLGGVAAGLNMHFFSIACWGQGSWAISAGMIFLAMAALSSKSIKQTWGRAILAGLAVGMGVMEGFDVGAILSVCVGVYVLFQVLNGEGSAAKKAISVVVTEALVIFFALFIASQTIFSLVETQIVGVGSMGQDEQTKEMRWNSATQWSLPKIETLQLVAPGLFGYRMKQHILNPDHSSAYWGDIGRDPRIAGLGSEDPAVRHSTAMLFNLTDEMRTSLNTPTRHERTGPMVAITKKAGIYWRYSGSGEFVGVLVSLLAIFALANVWRSQSPFAKNESTAVIFWGAVALFSLLASWGRFGFLYKLLYHLPYVSTIRNPIKFLNPFDIAWLILATYGLEALYRSYMRTSVQRADLLPEHLGKWWRNVPGFDKKWTVFALVSLAVSVVALLVLNASRNSLISYMEDQATDPQEAAKMAAFCITHAMWFVVFLGLSVLAITCIISRSWTGKEAKWGWMILGVLLVADLARADEPWIRYYDYTEKYSPNPIVDILQEKPYEHRVIGKLEPRGPGSGITPGFGEVYFFWIQNDFPYHNIQSLDFSQAPHMPDIDRDYLKAFELKGTDIRETDLVPAIRLWQLTNTRYILASANGVDLLNQRGRAINASFRIRSYYNIVRKPNIMQPDDVGDLTAEEAKKGAFALIEYEGALPRVKLYSDWAIPTNDAAGLETLTQRSFDPEKTVLVSPETPVAAPSPGSGTDPGTATITEYHPKFIQIQADAKTPAVLLLNDRTAPHWQVTIDKKPAEVLRCNFIMRGVLVPSGSHTVEFRYKPPLKTLFVTLCAIASGIAVAGYLMATRDTSGAPSEKPAAPAPAPASVPAPAASVPAQAAKPAATSAKPSKGSGKKKTRKV